jgi:hypothetical protein
VQTTPVCDHRAGACPALRTCPWCRPPPFATIAQDADQLAGPHIWCRPPLFATKAQVSEARANPSPPSDQKKAPRNPKGVNQHKKEERSVDNVNRPKGGNDTTYTLRRLARDNPEAKQQDIASEVGTSRQFVHQVLSSKSCDSQEKLDVPPHLNGDHEKADFRKLPAELREKSG